MLLTTAAMRDQDRVRVRLGIVGDEESEEEADRGSDHLVDSGFIGDFAITGEPTDLQIGVEAKGVLALRLRGQRRRRPRRDALAGRQRRAEGARRFPQYRVATVCPAQLGAVRPPLDQPRPDPGRRRAQQGARPMRDRRRHPLPARPGSRRPCSSRCGAFPTPRSTPLFTRPPAVVDRDSPFVRGLREAAAAHHEGEPMSVGRDGASDAVSFLRVGVPAVEFGPVGRRAPRPRGVGLGLLAGRLPADARAFLRALPDRLERLTADD